MEGSKDLLTKAREKFDAIMATPDTYQLPADKAAAVEEKLRIAHKALVKE